MSYTPEFKTEFQSTIAPALQKKFGYKNVMEIPKLTKICLNIGMGEAVQDPKKLDTAVAELALITGQKAAVTIAKKAISNFKLREDVRIGAKVTLRGDRMYDFLKRFIAVACPRIRDFKGLPITFDGRGNYNIGLTEQLTFPEIDIDKISKIYGMNINFITTAKTDEEAQELFRSFGMPFQK